MEGYSRSVGSAVCRTPTPSLQLCSLAPAIPFAGLVLSSCSGRAELAQRMSRPDKIATRRILIHFGYNSPLA
jgi:hypothetical protein